MKRIVAAVLMILLLLSACNYKPVAPEQNDPADNPEPMLVKSTITVSHYNISLTIPDTWEYETLKGDNNTDCAIALWPKGETEGRLKLCYFENFGVCGTGLKTEEITLGDYKAYKGIYGNAWIWEYICFAYDAPGSYVVLNEGAEKWWSRYGKEAMEILSTIKIGEYITVDE